LDFGLLLNYFRYYLVIILEDLKFSGMYFREGIGTLTDSVCKELDHYLTFSALFASSTLMAANLRRSDVV